MQRPRLYARTHLEVSNLNSWLDDPRAPPGGAVCTSQDDQEQLVRRRDEEVKVWL